MIILVPSTFVWSLCGFGRHRIVMAIVLCFRYNEELTSCDVRIGWNPIGIFCYSELKLGPVSCSWIKANQIKLRSRPWFWQRSIDLLSLSIFTVISGLCCVNWKDGLVWGDKQFKRDHVVCVLWTWTVYEVWQDSPFEESRTLWLLATSIRTSRHGGRRLGGNRYLWPVLK